MDESTDEYSALMMQSPLPHTENSGGGSTVDLRHNEHGVTHSHWPPHLFCS